MYPGKANPKYLNTGDENGNKWIPAEADVSIRPGWFWHESENTQVRSAKNLVNLYYQSVGRNSLMLLNIPPNTEGLVEDADIKAIDSFHTIINQTFSVNLLKGKISEKLTDNDLGSYFLIKVNQPLEIELEKAALFDRFLLQENIGNGQKIKSGILEYWHNGKWKTISYFSTVGYKRLLRFNSVKANKIRLTITAARYDNLVQLSSIGIYKASEGE